MSDEGTAPNSLALQQAIDDACQHHKAGRLAEAKGIYQQILRADPGQPVALHLLGVVALQSGENLVAADLMARAVAVKPDYPEAHNNLGLAFHGLGKLDDVAASHRTAVTFNGEFAQAHNNLGVAIQGLGKLREARASYHRATAIMPDYAEAHNNLGVVLKDLGQPDDAVASCRQAVEINDDYAEAHNNLGNAFQDLGKLDEAVASYRRAVAIRADYAEAHNNLGEALHNLGKLDEAFACYRRATALDPGNDLFWAGLAVALRSLSFTSADDNLRRDLLHLLERSTVRPGHVVPPIIGARRHDTRFSRIQDLVGADAEIDFGDIAERLSSMPLFLRLMELTTIHDLAIERMLTRCAAPCCERS
jgi:tetratricopeptide (TPR) repeat protein